MTTAFQLLVNDVDVTPPAEWDATWEERVDGVGSASVTIQDRVNSSSVHYGASNTTPGTDIPTGGTVTVGWRDLITLKVGGNNVYHGEITRSQLDLPAGFPWRRWKITAADFNAILDTRLVGAPDGYTWESMDGGITYQTVDPNAHGLISDADTVAALFDIYVRKPLPDAGAFDTSTFVNSWIPANVMVDPVTGLSRLQWTNTTLRSALDEMRALAGFPLFCWIDPNDAVHWEAFNSWALIAGGGLTMMSPTIPFSRAAPAAITDDPNAINGTTLIGGRNLRIEYDSDYMPQETYIVGVTDFILDNGFTIFQGTGYSSGPGRQHQNPLFRQVLIDAQAVTEAEMVAVSKSHINYARRARLRGSITIGQDDEVVDGWHCGQLLTITDDRLPPGLNGHSFPIQRVSGSLKAGNDFRVYTLEFGDFPIPRFSQKFRTTPQRIGTARLPAKRHQIELATHHLLPSHTYTAYSQMVDHSGKPLRMAGVPVIWALSVTNSADAVVAEGSISGIDPETDIHGRTAATLETGTSTGLHYHLTATTPAQ